MAGEEGGDGGREVVVEAGRVAWSSQQCKEKFREIGRGESIIRVRVCMRGGGPGGKGSMGRSRCQVGSEVYIK